MTKKCAEWWLRRIERMTYLNGGDGSQTRIDHFIGMIEPWKVELGAKTGRAGERRVGIGRLLLSMMRGIYGTQMPFYPEDLGECTEETDRNLDKYRLRRMGLAVRWLRKDMPKENYLNSSNNPDNYTERIVALSSNHDYPSLVKYIQEMQAEKPKDYQKYLNVLTSMGHNVELGVSASRLAELEVERVIRSRATIAMVAVWDVLGLALQYNTPNEADPLKNWEWRLTEGDMSRLRSRMGWLSVLNASREKKALAT